MADLATFRADLGDIPVFTDPVRVRQKSRDYYWYSPVLKPRFDNLLADVIVMPRNEDDILATLRACFRHDVPLTVRGGGTGNYGQAMPMKGGVVLDVSMLDEVLWVKPGVARVQAGRKMLDLDEALAPHGQEIRLYPSTRRTATIGGHYAGGSAGVGAVTWGLLRDKGALIGARVLTLEEEPRILELRGADVRKVNHSYGTTGVITELEIPLAPAYEWVDAVAVFDDFMEAARFGQALAEEPAILKKECAVMAAPIPHLYLKPLSEFVPEGAHAALMMVAAHSWEAFAQFASERGARIVYKKTAHAVEEERRVPLYEFTWNHTTLWALKVDPTLTYLQTRFLPPNNLERVEKMYRHFGDEVMMHIEFMRHGGVFTNSGLQIVRYTTEKRLREIMDFHDANGCHQFNPHAWTLEEGGMKVVDQVQLAFKREVDPKGLLNPGKMLAWDDPTWTPDKKKTAYKHTA